MQSRNRFQRALVTCGAGAVTGCGIPRATAGFSVNAPVPDSEPDETPSSGPNNARAPFVGESTPLRCHGSGYEIAFGSPKLIAFGSAKEIAAGSAKLIVDAFGSAKEIAAGSAKLIADHWTDVS